MGVTHNGIPVLRSRAMGELARKNGFDVLIFGHTHRGFVKQERGILYVNPGSPTQPLLAEPSVAILKISREKVEVEIVVIGK
ncbi:MAG: YfcE family phosphodiesterase [Candidatus Hydrothermarchaeota archaeon]|nr:YfcE family phosphodiesterase [Candidatus Hydrothermarchaeota archaeon]